MTNILLATSNGTGMGHLTRQAAVALALSKENNATLFSLSLGLPLATGLGIRGEYCPSYDRPWIASRDWHAYLRDRLIAIVEETGSEAVVFDGVAPYPGIGLAASQLRDVAFVWLRRGMWQANTTKRQLRKRRYFDLVIEPGDLAANADRGPTAGLSDAVKVAPISILEVLEPLPKEEARRQLGLPSEGLVALVTLGSGRLGDVAGPGRVSLETLLRFGPDWHVAVTRSPVALNEVPIEQASRITELRDVYPLARYLSAFDMAVSSAGYNAVHELLPAGIASLLVANTSTRTDDQTARARELERIGVSLFAEDVDGDTVAARIESMLNEDLRLALASKAGETRASITGASEAGAVTAEFASQFGVRQKRLSEAASERVQWAKEATKEALGEKRTASLKRLLGREATPAHGRTQVRVTNHIAEPSRDQLTDLALVGTVSETQLRIDAPIEHVMAGTSVKYETRRREIVEEFYDVVG